MPILLQLFLTFAKIGLFTFGGGYAMISIIENLCVERKKWITPDEMMEITVIAESTPGPIAINCATYVGQKTAGFLGSIVATFAIALPSFGMILLIATVLDNFLEISLIANAFKGIKIGVGLLIFSVGLTMIKKMPPKLSPRLIAGCACAAMLVIDFLSLNVSSIALMLIAGTLSLIVFTVEKGGGVK